MIQQWRQQELVIFPRCDYDTETTGHILQCLNPMAWEIGNRNTKELRAILKDLETKPNMMGDLSQGFHMWSSNQSIPPMLTDVGRLQSFISWENFSHGFLAVSWQTQQQ